MSLLVRSLCLSLALAAAVAAQLNTFPATDYFREQWVKAPVDMEIESVSRLEDFLYDGKLELSLRGFVELVIANNPDVSLQKLAVYEARNGVERAFNPFDPNLSANFTSNRSTTPSNDILQGADVRSQLTQRGAFTFDQTLQTGTNYSIGYTGTKSADNSQFTNFNPSITQRLAFTIDQPLLRGRGRYIQRIPIMIAQSRLDLTEEQVRESIIQLLFQAENDYWNAVNERENLKVQQNSLELARASLERSRRELELGAISPLDIYQPEQQFATAQVRVTQAGYRLQQATDAVRRWIGADLDPAYRQTPVDLAEPVDPPVYTPTVDPEQAVAIALNNRPELEQSRRALQIDDYNIRGATNQLRPDLVLSGNYSAQGRGGNFFERTLTGGSTGRFIPGGFPLAIDQLFQFTFPTYGFGLTLNLPLRNRRAAADLSDATIQKKRDLFALRSDEQRIRLEVVQAVAGVELSKATVQQATVALDFAQKRLDAEQKKYDLGVTTIFLLLTAQSDLVTAQSDLLSQTIAYRRSILSLLRATGELLKERGVVLTYNDNF